MESVCSAEGFEESISTSTMLRLLLASARYLDHDSGDNRHEHERILRACYSHLKSKVRLQNGSYDSAIEETLKSSETVSSSSQPAPIPTEVDIFGKREFPSTSHELTDHDWTLPASSCSASSAASGLDLMGLTIKQAAMLAAARGQTDMTVPYAYRVPTIL